MKPTQEDTIYIIETDVPVNQNSQNSGTPMIFVEEQYGGNVNFNDNNGFRPTQKNQGNGGFIPNQESGGNGNIQIDGGVNFDNNQQNPTSGGNKNNEGHQEKSEPDGKFIPMHSYTYFLKMEKISNIFLFCKIL